MSNLNMSSENRHVYESKYISVQPPLLVSRGADALAVFDKEYKRYAKLRAKDNMPVLEMRECVDDDLKRVISFRDKTIFESEKNFADFVASELKLNDVSDIMKSFGALHMNMREKDVKARLAEYDSQFFAVLDRVDQDVWKPKMLVQSYVDGLQPSSVRSELQTACKWQELSIEDVMQLAEEKVLQQDEFFKLQASETRSPIPPNRKPASGSNNSVHMQSFVPHPTATSPEQHSARTSSSATPGRPHRDYAGKCKYCGGKYTPEHFLECKRKHMEAQSKSNSTSNNSAHGQRRDSAQSSRPAASHHVSPVATHHAEQCVNKDQPITLPCKIGDFNILAEADTGSMLSCISSSLLNELMCHTKLVIEPSPLSFDLANQSTAPALRAASFVITAPTATVADSFTGRWTFYELAGDKHRLLLGRDFLSELGIISEMGIHMPFVKSSDDDATEADDLNDPGIEVPVHATDVHRETTNDELNEQINLIQVGEGPLHDSILEILRKRKHVFDPNLPEDGVAFPPYHIELTSPEAFNAAPRNLKPELRDKVHAIIEEWKSQHIAQDSASRYSSPIVAVRKGDKIRVCGDYRKLNSQTVPIEADESIPDIRSFLQQVSGKKWYAKCDMRTSFLQMLLDSSSIPLTALRTPDDFIELTRLAFGLRNASIVFQREMSAAFSDLLYKILMIFIDDVVIFGNSDEEFLTALDLYLERCEKLRIRLRAEKCSFGMTVITALGYVIDRSGRHMSEQRVAAVKDIPVPKNAHELRMFLGCINYFHEFIEDLAEISAPLYALLENDTPFIWTDTCDSSFNMLKDSLSSEKILAFPSDEGEIVLRPDASGMGIGGVLLLRTPSGDKPITYYSHKLSPTQQRWATVEQELYSLVYGVTLTPYSDLLRMKHFTIETDHRNLVFLEKLCADKPKLLRWRMILLEYEFSVNHIPGTENSVADLLSRVGYTCDALPVHAIEATAESAILQEVRTAQQANKEIFEKAAAFFDKETRFFYNQSNLIIVPDSAHEAKRHILEIVHGSATAGHCGINRTIDNIKATGFYWTNMPKDVSSFIDNCGVCQKMSDKEPEVEMRTIVTNRPFATVAVDAVGPFPEDKHGYRYLLVFIDMFTRWTEIYPTVATDAYAAAEAMMACIFLRHGLPRVIQSDNGTQYVNELIQNLLRCVRVAHRRILPYNPRANGVVERTNREIVRHIRCLTLQFRMTDAWSELIPFVMYIVNNTVHSSLGVTPYVMMHGDGVFERRDILECLSLDENSVLHRFPELADEQTVRAARDYVVIVTKRLLLIQSSARAIQEAVIEARLKKYNDGVLAKKYKVGDFVLLVPVKRVAKLQAKLLGPFKVIEVKSEGNVYRIQSLIDPAKMQDCPPIRIRPFASDLFSDQEIKELATADAEEFMVDYVKTHQGTGRRNLRFLVKWEGYPDSDQYNTWEPISSLEGCEKFEDYLDTHPEAARLVRN